jgi:hypothetical protein
MKNYISTFSKDLKNFADSHTMVDDIKFIRGEKELNNMVFDRKTMLVSMLSANLDNEDSRPVYDVEYVIAIIDKSPNGLYGSSATVEENLFVVSQLQDYLQQEGWSVVFGDVDIQADWDESGDLVAVLSSATAQFGRGLSSDIAF